MQQEDEYSQPFVNFKRKQYLTILIAAKFYSNSEKYSYDKQFTN